MGLEVVMNKKQRIIRAKSKSKISRSEAYKAAKVSKQEWEQRLISDINRYGIYRQGLTPKEIKNYLKILSKTTALIRFSKLTTKELYRKFVKIAGVNTMALVTLPDGTVNSLMYRHDVKRFADGLFLGKSTYFD